jgi:hypothetical protein
MWQLQFEGSRGHTIEDVADFYLRIYPHAKHNGGARRVVRLFTRAERAVTSPSESDSGDSKSLEECSDHEIGENSRS